MVTNKQQDFQLPIGEPAAVMAGLHHLHPLDHPKLKHREHLEVNPTHSKQHKAILPLLDSALPRRRPPRRLGAPHQPLHPLEALRQPPRLSAPSLLNHRATIHLEEPLYLQAKLPFLHQHHLRLVAVILEVSRKILDCHVNSFPKVAADMVPTADSPTATQLLLATMPVFLLPRLDPHSVPGVEDLAIKILIRVLLVAALALEAGLPFLPLQVILLEARGDKCEALSVSRMKNQIIVLRHNKDGL